MNSEICTKCGSNKLMKDISIMEQGHGAVQRHLSVRIPTTKRLLFNNYEKGIIKAQVCGNCGSIEFSASNFRALWEAYTK